MRKSALTALMAAIVSVGALFSGSANAMTQTAPIGLYSAIEDSNIVEPTRYVCYRVRRGGGWRRVCSYRRGYYKRGYYKHRRPGVYIRL